MYWWFLQASLCLPAIYGNTPAPYVLLIHMYSVLYSHFPSCTQVFLNILVLHFPMRMFFPLNLSPAP